MKSADHDRLVNLTGAWTVGVADRIHDATSRAAGRGAQAPAALVALHEFCDGRSVEHLRSVLGLSHSATVRVVDALEDAGFVVRRRVAGDGREVAVSLTAAGKRKAAAVTRARRSAIADVLAGLSPAEQHALSDLLERLVGELTAVRLRASDEGSSPPNGWLCRLCSFEACGRDAGDCPAASTAADLRRAAGDAG